MDSRLSRPQHRHGRGTTYRLCCSPFPSGTISQRTSTRTTVLPFFSSVAANSTTLSGATRRYARTGGLTNAGLLVRFHAAKAGTRERAAATRPRRWSLTARPHAVGGAGNGSGWRQSSPPVSFRCRGSPGRQGTPARLRSPSEGEGLPAEPDGGSQKLKERRSKGGL